MHELGMTRGIVDTSLEAMEGVGATHVCAVHVTVGEVRDIVDELFQSCFSFCARGTQAEGAELVVTRTPLAARCRTCGTVFRPDARGGDGCRCPCCKEAAYDVCSGMEFYISQVVVA